jgi:hypothetical protein
VLLRLTVPLVHAQLDQLVVDCWHVGVGERVGFGDDLCSLTAQSRRRAGQRRPLAKWLFEGPRSDGPMRSEPRLTGRELGTDVLVEVCAADEAILRRIVCEPGAAVGIGDLLGLLTTDADEPLESGVAATPGGFRTVANLVVGEELL